MTAVVAALTAICAPVILLCRDDGWTNVPVSYDSLFLLFAGGEVAGGVAAAAPGPGTAGEVVATTAAAVLSLAAAEGRGPSSKLVVFSATLATLLLMSLACVVSLVWRLP